MSALDLINIRDYREENDRNFVVGTWVHGLYYGSPHFFREVPKHIFFANYHKYIDIIMTAESVKTTMAVLKTDDDVALGFSVSDPNCLHWVFVKPEWRKLGIATLLVPKTITEVSHITEVGKSIKRKKRLIFNPF